MLRMASNSIWVLIAAGLLASCGPTGIPIVTTAPPVVTSETSNPDCDGSGVTSSSDSFSVGSTGGCITSIDASLAAEVATIRTTSMYSLQNVRHSVDRRNYTSNSLLAGRFEYAHALNLTGAEQIVAVYDNGFRADHLEFSGKSVTYGFGTNADTITQESHGTAVAGLIGGTANAGQTLGAAPNVSLHLASWSDGGATADIAVVREAEALGAIAINNSWGYTCSDAFDECGTNDYTTSFIGSAHISALTDYAGDEGIVVFAASNEENQTQATYMAALPRIVPALEEGWLTVINLARDYDAGEADLFDDSQVGRLSSGCLEAARWCLAADGTSYIATATSSSSYSTGTGTSYAAPRVSAAVALLAEAFPNLTAKEIRNRLLLTADNDFFSSDTANIQTLTFAGGLTHDYHNIYGHGFVDMRAALLPIGTTRTTTSVGAIELGKPVIVASSATGDALVRGLNGLSLRAVDAMGAEFTTNATGLAAQASTDTRHTAALSVFDDASGQSLAKLSQAAYLQTLPWDSATRVPLDLGAGLNATIALPQHEGDDIALSFVRSAAQDAQSWSFGLTAAYDPSSMLGLSLGDAGAVNSTHVGISADYEAQLGDGLTLAANGYWGAAQAQSSGVLNGFDGMRYNAMGLQLSQANVGLRNSQLTFFAQQPTAMTGGSAQAQLDIYDDAGKASLQNIDIGLAPSAREYELGLEYSIATQGGTEWLARASQRMNAGNRSGVEETHVLIGLRHAF